MTHWADEANASEKFAETCRAVYTPLVGLTNEQALCVLGFITERVFATIESPAERAEAVDDWCAVLMATTEDC